jgi:uncharacterized membrane protein (UPF0182 family)
VVAGALLLLIFLDQIVDLWTDWLWYTEVGYTEVFGGLIRTRIWLFILFGIGVGAFVAANLYLAFRLRPMLRTNSPEQQALERYRMVLSPRIGLWIGLAAALIGLFAGISGQGHWQQWLLFTNGGDFGVADPQFGADVGFYVFDYPFWRYLLDVGFTATALSVLGALAVHYVYGGVRLQGVGDRMSAGARAHLTALVALFVLLKAVAYFLDRRALLLDFNSGTGLYGAGYTDINAVLPAKEILAYISIVVAVAILVFSNVGTRNLVWAGASLALLGIAAVAIGGIYPAVVQQFTVKPNVRDKEADYIGRTIEFTRQGYGLTNVNRSPYSARTLTPPASLSNDRTVVPTIRLLDPAVVNETYTQFQQIRSFYDFPRKLDVDRYMVDGRLQDFVVSVREINYGRLQGSQTNWPNRHTVYTHGYGFVAAPANLICEGQPVFVAGLLSTGPQQNDACAAQSEAIPVDQPRIYYGELANYEDYVIVGKAPNSDRDLEFDRPAGDAEELFSYDGRGGVPVASLWRRMLYGLHFRDANYLLSDVFNDNSKVIYVRNPRERVERVAPFLTLDTDPYPAVVGGRVVWILDGYTTSATYPYSQRVDLREVTEDTLSNIGAGTVLQARQNINYIRNSVKATVDAYDGTVSLYAFDDSDPILTAWNKAFGGSVIKPRSEIPPDLAAHFRYPEDLFKVQRDILSQFHVSDPKQFNSAQDFWQVPDDPATASGGTGVQPPYYLLTQFPGATTQRFQLTAALTPINRPNLSALLTGVLDSEGRPRLELLELPRENRIPGPTQAQQNMANDSEARQRINLLQAGQGAQVVYANLLSLPYAEGLLYVQPVYVKSANVANPFPKMSLVLVSYGSTVGFAETLQGAIAELVRKAGGQAPPPGEEPPTQPPPTTGPPGQNAELSAAIAKIDAALVKLSAAYKTGDFNQIGAATAELDRAIKEYKAVEARLGAGGGTGATPTATPSASPTTAPPG